MKNHLIVALILFGTTLTAQTRHQYNAHERELRQQRYTMRLDSLISSNEFQFVPVSMVWEPGGGERMINNLYYYVAVSQRELQVHIPVVVGRALSYNAMLNFDTNELSDRETQKTDSGWETSFTATDNQETRYKFTFIIYNVTGEVVLNLVTTRNTISYIGSVSPNEEMAGVP